MAALGEAAPTTDAEMLTGEKVMAFAVAPAKTEGLTDNVVVMRAVLNDLMTNVFWHSQCGPGYPRLVCGHLPW